MILTESDQDDYRVGAAQQDARSAHITVGAQSGKIVLCRSERRKGEGWTGTWQVVPLGIWPCDWVFVYNGKRVYDDPASMHSVDY